MSNQTSAAPSKATKATPAKTPHPELTNAITALAADSKTLVGEIAKQEKRVTDAAEVAGKHKETMAAVEAEKIPFAQGSAEIAALNAQGELLEFQLQKRSQELKASYLNLRDRSLRLKTDLLRAIDLAGGAVAAGRQKEAATWLESLAGEKPADASPVPLRILSQCCPDLRKLEEHRVALEAIRPDAGVEKLLGLARVIVDDLERLPALPDEPTLFGGYVSNNKVSIYGWAGRERRHEFVGDFENEPSAMEFFSTIRGKTGWLGLAEISLFEQSHPRAHYSFASNEALNPDHNQNNHAGTKELSGRCRMFFEEVSAWLAGV